MSVIQQIFPRPFSIRGPQSAVLSALAAISILVLVSCASEPGPVGPSTDDERRAKIEAMYEEFQPDFPDADEIDVVVLDRTMPNVGGEEAFDEIRRIRPDAHIILLSGYSEERATWDFIDRGFDAFLHKPFEPAALLKHVRRVIDSS